jgi:hypothetical protein
MTNKRPTLAFSGVSAREYRDASFERDVARVQAGDGHRYPRVSVASFCPDFPDVPMYSEPGRSFQALRDSYWFLCAFFAAQLLDQASHHTTGSVRHRAGTDGIPVLAGLLGSYWDVIEPGFLLLVLGLYEPPLPVKAVADAVGDLVSAEFAVLRSHAGYAQIIGAAEKSFVAAPSSLRAFVPHGDAYKWQPAPDVVRTLRASALRALNPTAV